MLFKSHLIVGACAWYVATTYNETLPVENTFCWALVLIGSLLPDIDHPKSIMGQAAGILSKAISMLFGHRGITHSFLAVFVIFLYFSNSETNLYVTALLIGYLSHLAADFMTSSGVPLFWPWKRRFRMPFAFKAGGVTENLVVILCIVASGVAPFIMDGGMIF